MQLGTYSVTGQELLEGKNEDLTILKDSYNIQVRIGELNKGRLRGRGYVDALGKMRNLVPHEALLYLCALSQHKTRSR